MSDINKLPQELQQELGGVKTDDRKYTAKDLVLTYIAQKGEANANDLLIYLWSVTGKVTKRPYLYHILTSLRQGGFIYTENSSIPNKATNCITLTGLDAARPYKETAK